MTRFAPRFAALAAAAFLFAGPAFAQEPAASHLQAARDAATGSGIVRTFDAILPQFSEQIRQQAVTRPELAKDLNEVLKALEPELELQKQQMINRVARIFAAQLSEAELKQITAFFDSPAGKRYVETQPLVLDELVKQTQDWTQEVAEYLMVRTRAEMAKRGHSMQ